MQQNVARPPNQYFGMRDFLRAMLLTRTTTVVPGNSNEAHGYSLSERGKREALLYLPSSSILHAPLQLINICIQ